MVGQAQKKHYYYGLGRRKGATARVRLFPSGKGMVVINGKPGEEYVNYKRLLNVIKEPLVVVGQDKSYNMTFKVEGGGFQGQVQAMKLAVAKALLKVDEEFRKALRPIGLLTTDSRVKERKKYGLKKARKAPQYTKR